MNGILPKLAFNSIKKNKIRTLSTSIGIGLAVILMTVVVILATSISASMIAGANEKYGSWHIMSEDITQEQLEKMTSDNIIESICYVKNVGYMQIDSPINTTKPYIHLVDVSQNFLEYQSLKLEYGRMPENGTEILVSSQFLADYPEINIDDSFNFDIGQRINSETGDILWQNSSYLGESKECVESKNIVSSYIIVGVIENINSVEYTFSPGYTLLTCGIQSIEENTKVYLKLNNLSSNLDKVSNYLSEEKIIYNTKLLNYLGVSDGENMQSILRAIIVVLIVIIGVAVFVLINNSLMVSSDERSKQFGILFSVGMTRAQTFLMYLVEVLTIGLVSILVGLAIGIIFSFLSFNAIGSYIASASYLNLSLNVNLNFLYLGIVVLIAFIILVLTALFNALQQMKGTAINKLRKNGDIKKSKERKNKKRKLYLTSIEWNIVWNSFKRYNKKYRYVIISLSLSAILFVSCGLFSGYAKNYVRDIMPTTNYDIQVYSRGSDMFDIIEKQYKTFSELEEIKSCGWLSSIDAGYISLDGLNLDESYKHYIDNKKITNIAVTYIIINEEHYSILSGASQEEIYFYDNMTYFNNDDQYTSRLFQDDRVEITFYYMNEEQRSSYYETGLLEENSTAKEISMYRAESKNFPMELEAITNSSGLFFIIPANRINEFSDIMPTELQMYFSASDHSSAVQKIKQLGEENNWNLSVTDIAESFEKEKSTYTMYEIFAVIFTILISLVSIINAFNAVSANLIKRRREFAVLQSIGLSEKGFYRLITYECLLLCLIVVAFTIIVAPIISALLSISFNFSNYVFISPLKYILIIICSLFIIFFMSMIKPMYIIRKQNVIETIKGDTD